MIKIFNATDKDFSTAGNIIIEPTKCIEFKKKSLNGWYIEVEIPIKYKAYIEKDKLCVIKTKSKIRPQAFRIGENIQYTNRKITFTAEHVMFDSKNYFLVDVRPTSLNGINTLNYINQRTDIVSPFKIFSNVENIDTAYFIRKNLFEAWTIIEERWNGVFDADNWEINFLQNVGKDNGESIIYGKNMQSMEIYEDWSNVVTKIYPVGYDGLMLPEKYIESNIKYDVPYTKKVEFQTDFEQEEQTEQNLINELRNNALKYIEENKYPKVSYTITSNINNDMEIGDIIQVLHPLVNIKTEVLEYEYNVNSKKIKSLTFGNYSRDVKIKFNNIKETISKLNETISNQMSVINKQTDLINSLNKNGYVYIDDNEILILDKIPKSQAKNVWRFGLGGIGFSSTGYEGPFEIAITMDGQINAKFITTGTMSVSRIEGLANKISEYDKSIAEININLGSIKQSVAETKTEIQNDLKNSYYKKTETDSQITQKADEITSTVNKNISTAKQEAIDSANESTDNKLKDYSTTSEMNSQITQKANEIIQMINEIEDVTNTVEGVKTISLGNCVEGSLLELHIYGNNNVFDYLYPANNLYPANDLYPYGDSRIDVTDQEGNTVTYELGITEVLRSNGDIKDEYVLENGKAKIIRRISSSGSVLSKETIQNLGELHIDLAEGTNTITIKNYSATLNARFAIQNSFTDIYATKVEMHSSIRQTAEQISSEVEKKVDETELGTKIIQDFESVMIAWNNISDFIKYINAELRIYNNDKKLLMILNKQGQAFYDSGIKIGNIGSNHLSGDITKKSLSFDLAGNGSYMTWASQKKENDLNYMKWTYCKGGIGQMQNEGLYAGTNVYFNGYEIYVNRYVYFNGANVLVVKEGNGFVFRLDNGTVSFDLDGSIYCNNIYSSNTSSDGRLKKNIAESDIDAIEIINKIPIRSFDWKKNAKHVKAGFIAQEMEKIDENFVLKEPVRDEKNEIIDYKYHMNDLPILATLIKAFQDQDKVIKKQGKLIDKILEKVGLKEEVSNTIAVKNQKKIQEIIEQYDENIKEGNIEKTPEPIKIRKIKQNDSTEILEEEK